MSSSMKLSNNSIGRLSSSASATATTLSLVPGDGAKFPALAAGEYFPLTLIRASDGAIEIVKVTARATDVLTIQRAKEGTASLSFIAGDRVELRMTAATFLDEVTRLDSDISTAQTTANAALPKVGGLVTGNVTMGAGTKIIFEGVTDDAFETTLDPGDPTADRTITLPNKSGTMATEEDSLQKSGGTLSGLLKFAEGSAIASSATIDLSTATGNTVHITGTTAITNIVMSDGQIMDVVFDGFLTLTHHATNNKLPGATNITTEAGDTARYFYDGTTVYCLQYQKTNGQAVVSPTYSIASTAEAQTGTENTKALSSLRLREAINAAGSAPIYACRAWVNFNGSGTVAIRASGNVSSITDNGLGDYTVNFSTAMPDPNYAWSFGESFLTGFTIGARTNTVAPSASALRIGAYDNGSLTNDPAYVTVSIHR